MVRTMQEGQGAATTNGAGDFASRIGMLGAGPAPLYRRLQRRIADAIAQRQLLPGEVLPPERELAESLDISRVTVRKAFEGLVDSGLLVRRQGAGTFVAERVEKNFAAITSFSEDMIARGRVPRSTWVSRSEGLVTPEEAMALGLSPGTAVYRFTRIRHADDVSMALEYSTIPAWALADFDSAGDSLYAALGDLRPVRILQRLRAILFPADHAALLEVAAGSAGLEIERRGYSRDGRTVEFTRSFYRGDSYDFVSELVAAEGA